MAKKRRLKLGDIYEIPLPDGKNAYGRLFKEYVLAIYEGVYPCFEALPENAAYVRFVGVYKYVLQDDVWAVVGNRPFENEQDAWAPPMCIVDAITQKGSLYYQGEITPCSYEECKDLEVVAAWDRHQIVDMLMGTPIWDESIGKPI